MSKSKTTFDKKIQELLGAHKPEDIEELILDEISDNIKSFNLDQKESLELYTKLIHLSLNNIGLENLSNLPNIKGLMYLSLKNNKLNCLDELQLKKIEVKDNPFSRNDANYREKIYKLFPTVEIVDQKLKNGQEIDTSDYGDMSSSMEDEEYEDDDDNADNEDSDESDGNDDDSNDSEEEYNEENEDEEGTKKKKKK